MSDPSKRPAYHSRVFDVFEEDVALPNGHRSRMSRVDHRPTIAVVPVDGQGNVVLIRQYRHATGGMLLEIPAGTIDRSGESAEACAQRELAEEAGFRAGTLVPLFEGYLVPGYGNEYMYFFLARDLVGAKLPADEDEYIEVVFTPFAEARRMIWEREIRDVKTALGIQMAQEYLERERRGAR